MKVRLVQNRSGRLGKQLEIAVAYSFLPPITGTAAALRVSHCHCHCHSVLLRVTVTVTQHFFVSLSLSLSSASCHCHCHSALLYVSHDAGCQQSVTVTSTGCTGNTQSPQHNIRRCLAAGSGNPLPNSHQFTTHDYSN